MLKVVETNLASEERRKMRIKKLIAVLLTMSLTTQPLFAITAPENVHSKGVLLMEKESKRVLYEGHGHDEMPMASTTKIMTCLLVLESANLDDIVTVSSKAARAPKVKLGLQTGEKQRLGDLLYSLMMESHNDSAVAIAEHVGGSVEAFCDMMTAKAKELGAQNTSFKTPNGLDAEGHYSTPYDMALITACAIDNPKFIEITNTLDKSIPSSPLEGSKAHSLINKNRFIREYQGAIGVKTGYTSKAGHCFVGAARRNDMELIAVALGAGCDKAAKARKYTDVKKMMNYGFENYKMYEVVEAEDSAGDITVDNGKEQSVALVCEEGVTLPLNKEETASIELKKTLPSNLAAPVKENQVVGRMDVVCQDEILESIDIIATNSVEKATLLDKLKRLFFKE